VRRTRATSLVVILIIAIGGLTATLIGGKSPQLGLDLQGGASVVLTPKKAADSGQLKQAQSIIRNRVDGLGVAEPDIHLEGKNIVVQLPGVKNANRALELVGETAELRFRPVLQTYPPGLDVGSLTSSTDTTPGSDTSSTASSSTTAPADSTSTSQQGLGTGAPEGESAAPLLPAQTDSSTTTTTAAATTTTAASTSSSSGSTTSTAKPTTTTAAPGKECGPDETNTDNEKTDQQVIYPEKDDKLNIINCYILGPTVLTGSGVSGASATIPSGQWTVEVTLTSDGLSKINDIAQKCFSKDPTICPLNQFAIVLDGVVKSAPQFDTPSFDSNKITITRPNGFPEGEAKDLALVLRYGALPVELVPQTVQTVSATLGKDSLHAGLVAGFIGLTLVALYIVFYYRGLGIVVILGMSVWSALNFSIITYLSSRSGLALSLSGVTGIIVSVGVTVDSYVVFFERLKDEIRSGKTIRSSVDRGFQRAFRTIITADVSAFMAAALLYWLTVGSVRGFAFFLGLSTILDVVVTWTFTRPLVSILSRSRFFTEARWVGLARGLASAPAPAAAAGGGR
jgi:preprotein translocase subunit SecD